MGRIVCVHGVGKQVAGEQTLLRDWAPAVLDGLARADYSDPVGPDDLVMAFYGNLFRPAGQTLAVGDPMFTAADVEAGLEEELLLAWWQEAARVDPKVAPPDGETLVRVPGSVQAALRQLSRSAFSVVWRCGRWCSISSRCAATCRMHSYGRPRGVWSVMRG